jgi:hypothetical protein
MTKHLHHPRVGHWYTHLDKGEAFQVVGRDDHSRTTEIQAFDGDIDEVDDELWYALPLAPCMPPEDWTGPMDDIETDDLGYSETDMSPADWAEPLQQLKVAKEAWEDEEPDEDRDPLGHSVPAELLRADVPAANDRAG